MPYRVSYPDKIISKGLPEELVNFAADQFQEIWEALRNDMETSWLLNTVTSESPTENLVKSFKAYYLPMQTSIL